MAFPSDQHNGPQYQIELKINKYIIIDKDKAITFCEGPSWSYGSWIYNYLIRAYKH